MEEVIISQNYKSEDYHRVPEGLNPESRTWFEDRHLEWRNKLSLASLIRLALSQCLRASEPLKLDRRCYSSHHVMISIRYKWMKSIRYEDYSC
jgi:hypothetical protein